MYFFMEWCFEVFSSAKYRCLNCAEGDIVITRHQHEAKVLKAEQVVLKKIVPNYGIALPINIPESFHWIVQRVRMGKKYCLPFKFFVFTQNFVNAPKSIYF